MTEFNQALQSYIDTFLGRVTRDDREGASRRMELTGYYRTIADSSIAPAVVHDEKLLIEDVQKKLVASTQSAQAALQVGRQYTELKRLDPEHDWWPILYLLAETSVGGPQSTFGNDNYISSQMGSQGMANIFMDQVAPPVGSGHGTGAYSTAAFGRRSGPDYLAQDERTTFAQAGGADRFDERSRFAQTGGTDRFGERRAVEPPVGEGSESQGATGDEGFLHRALATHDDADEAVLLRDLIYVMQGISGAYISWNEAMGAFTVRTEVRLSRPTRTMVLALSELGSLCRDIQQYIGETDRQGKLYQQSFGAGLKREMAQYFKLVAVLEAQLTKAAAHLESGESALGLTLRRMHAWTIEPMQKLRLMVTAIRKVQAGKGGGELLSTLSTLTDDGDPFIHSFSRQLLLTASAPFNETLVRWVTDGELADPYEEFFIKVKAGQSDTLWDGKYAVAQDMIPVHINGDMPWRIYQIGRSLNFLRVACDDGKWVAEEGPRTQLTEDLADAGVLGRFVYQSAAMVNQRLMHVLMERFQLMAHIRALRRYLLLEQGDFAQALVETLDSLRKRLSRSYTASALHKDRSGVDLAAALTSAIRASNAQHEPPEVISAMRLVFRTTSDAPESPAPSAGAATVGDDVTITYVLSDPLDSVIPRKTMRRYSEINRFLLKLKRVEYSLGQLWQRQMGAARAVLRDRELRRRRKSSGIAESSAVTAEMRQMYRESEIACCEMVQFFHQVQRYISLNVIEGAWGSFVAATQPGHGDADIDRWSKAHTQYVDTIRDFVCNPQRPLLRPLTSLIDTTVQFVNKANEVYSERMLADSSDKARSLHLLIMRFRDHVRDFIGPLAHNTSSDLQCLVVTVNFNDGYIKSART
ncbi:Microtubule-nucleating Tub4p (gamma-tubulin) complex component [Linderina macrospora]|uniref:Microtubule-nucleating Tub4p (Gamma-tubulin) complex component n=1 Tax=Linderina macrospora TaxID=4868 RepID=A0ACC1JE77_9FUNG|nr:Microtubule-nucleating Tub4p (gamma-tubulin) complex component [Linderina macrospora]